MSTKIVGMGTDAAALVQKAAKYMQLPGGSRQIEVLTGALLCITSAALIPTLGRLTSIATLAGLSLLSHGYFSNTNHLSFIKNKISGLFSPPISTPSKTAGQKPPSLLWEEAQELEKFQEREESRVLRDLLLAERSISLPIVGLVGLSSLVLHVAYHHWNQGSTHSGELVLFRPETPNPVTPFLSLVNLVKSPGNQNLSDSSFDWELEHIAALTRNITQASCNFGAKYNNGLVESCAWIPDSEHMIHGS